MNRVYNNDEYTIESRRYIGSKAKLSGWILKLIREECEGEIFLDIFAGTGVISAKASLYFSKQIINDFIESNYVIYKAFFGMEEWDKEKLYMIIKKYNELDPKNIEENYFSVNFGNKYFSKNNAKVIGYIREDIERIKGLLNEKEYTILITSLVYSADKIANTVGHYDSFMKVKPKDFDFKLKLIKPIKTNSIIFKENSNILARKVFADIVYVDPPYNSRQYSRFYHVLDTLVTWDKPKLYGAALKPSPKNMSDYCRAKAPEVFKDLIDNLKCSYIVVSYNNTYNSKSNSSRNKIGLDEIKRILNERGKTKVYRKKYRYFNSGKTNFKGHQEYLFITKVRNEQTREKN